MSPLNDGQVIDISKEHLNRVIDGKRIHPLQSALYDVTQGEIEFDELPDGSVINVHIDGVYHVVCERIQLWLKACKALDGRVSPIKIELLVSEDGENILIMNYD